jgi:homeobox-leucine zipper protein
LSLQVTWVEHMEIEQMLPVNVLYRNLVLSGAAFGAHRWLAALQRACERFASLAVLGASHHDLAGGTRRYIFEVIVDERINQSSRNA